MGNLLCKCCDCLNTITTATTKTTTSDVSRCHHQHHHQHNHYHHHYRSCCCLNWSCLYFCCRHYCPRGSVIHNNSVGTIPEKKLKLLLLGLAGCGKTEIAHQLAQIERHDYQTTNGVHHYNIRRDSLLCSLTEIGGNEDMQKIWHHYYVSTMGLIYCFDMSGTYNALKNSFDLLHEILTNKCMRGKPVLLIATKSDLVDESIQLYDIENEFQLERITAATGSFIKLCHSNGILASSNMNGHLCLGIDWLLKYLCDNYDALQMRLKCDKNIQKWENQRNKLIAEGKLNLRKYQRFRTMPLAWHCKYNKSLPHSLKRPFTAPPITNVFTITSSDVSTASKAS